MSGGKSAFNLMFYQEYILKGVVNAALGQEQGLNDHIKIAQQYFQVSIEISPKS